MVNIARTILSVILGCASYPVFADTVPVMGNAPKIHFAMPLAVAGKKLIPDSEKLVKHVILVSKRAIIVSSEPYVKKKRTNAHLNVLSMLTVPLGLAVLTDSVYRLCTNVASYCIHKNDTLEKLLLNCNFHMIKKWLKYYFHEIVISKIQIVMSDKDSGIVPARILVTNRLNWEVCEAVRKFLNWWVQKEFVQNKILWLETSCVLPD